MHTSQTSSIVIYNSEGKPNFDVRLENDTVWLSQKQMAELFDKDRKTITEHIGNIYKENELDKNSTSRIFQLVQKEGSRSVKRITEHYDLDVILHVGYRVKSKQGTQFRKWASKVLSEHIYKGFSVNEKRLMERKIELEVRESNEIMSKIFLLKGVDPSEKSTQIIDHVSKYIGRTTDKETMVLKAQILIERFMVQFLKEKSKNEKALDNSRFTFRHLVTLCQLQHEPEDSKWVWELLNKLCKIRNNFAHILEVEFIEIEIEDFVRVCVLRLKKEGVSIQCKDKGLKFVLVHLCGVVYTVLS